MYYIWTLETTLQLVLFCFMHIPPTHLHLPCLPFPYLFLSFSAAFPSVFWRQRSCVWPCGKVDSDNLNEKCPHSLWPLNILSTVAGPVRGGLGGPVFLRTDFKRLRTHSTSTLRIACGSRCELPVSRSCQHSCHLLLFPPSHYGWFALQNKLKQTLPLADFHHVFSQSNWKITKQSSWWPQEDSYNWSSIKMKLSHPFIRFLNNPCGHLPRFWTDHFKQFWFPQGVTTKFILKSPTF